MYFVERVLSIFIEFINDGNIFTLFSCRMLLSSHKLLYYYVLRVSSMDAPYLCNIKNYNNPDQIRSELSLM